MKEREFVKNQKNQIQAQMELYAKLTKGHTVFELENGYWMISNSENGGLAWHRAKSNGEFELRTNNFTFHFLVRNPTELKGNDWETYSNRKGDIDYNDNGCNWKRAYNWVITGSDYRIPDLEQLQ